MPPKCFPFLVIFHDMLVLLITSQEFWVWPVLVFQFLFTREEEPFDECPWFFFSPLLFLITWCSNLDFQSIAFLVHVSGKVTPTVMLWWLGHHISLKYGRVFWQCRRMRLIKVVNDKKKKKNQCAEKYIHFFFMTSDNHNLKLWNSVTSMLVVRCGWCE